MISNSCLPVLEYKSMQGCTYRRCLPWNWSEYVHHLTFVIFVLKHFVVIFYCSFLFPSSVLIFSLTSNSNKAIDPLFIGFNIYDRKLDFTINNQLNIQFLYQKFWIEMKYQILHSLWILNIECAIHNFGRHSRPQYGTKIPYRGLLMHFPVEYFWLNSFFDW